MQDIMKNIAKADVLVLKDQVDYMEHQVVSKTLIQNDKVSITLFAFDKEEDTILETFPIGGPNHLDWFKQNGYSYKGESFFAKGRKNVAYATYYHDKTTDFPAVSAKEEYLRFLSEKKNSEHNGRRAS